MDLLGVITVGFVTIWAVIIMVWWMGICSPHFSLSVGETEWCCLTFIPPAWLGLVLSSIFYYTRK